MSIQGSIYMRLMNRKTHLQAVTSQTAQSLPKGLNYGWKPEHALAQKSLLSHDNWIMYQAQSILRRDVTLEEAEELFTRIDITTRQPIRTPKPRRPSGFVAALRALFGGGIFLIVASGCSAQGTTRRGG